MTTPGPLGGCPPQARKDSTISDDDDLRLEVHPEDTSTVVAVAGELDIATAPQLRDCLSDLRDGGVTTMILDFADVGLCDSTALGVIIGASKKLRVSGGTLSIRNVSPSVMKTFVFTGTDGVLGVTPVPE